MPVPRQGQDKTVAPRPPRPTLTVDTRDISEHTPNETVTQSAPVGTRQEKGIPPMYQAVDRHCAKLTEMMNSPTWRNQNPGPHVAMDVNMRSSNSNVNHNHVQSSLSSSPEDVIYTHRYKENKSRVSEAHDQSAKIPYSAQPVANAIHLGHDSQALRIISVDKFPNTPETSNAYIISAAVPLRQQDAFSGEMQATRVQRSKAQRKTAEDSDDHEKVQEGIELSDDEETPQEPVRSTSSPDDARAAWEAKEQHLDDNALELMEQDQAIESVNHHLRSHHRQIETSPDEKQRFRGLLDRLHIQNSADEDRVHKQDSTQEESKKDPSFIDPAIISSLPKRIDQGTPTKKSRHNRFDSAYSSLPDTTDSDFIRVQHEKDGSKDSGFDSPSKNSTLNPAAKAFSSVTSSRNASPAKGSVAHPVSSQQPFLPPQKDRGFVTSICPPEFVPPSHQSTGPWYPPLANFNAPTMGLPPMQQGHMQQAPFQFPPGMYSYLDNYAGGMMPLPSGISPPRLPLPFTPLPGLAPGMISSPGLGLGGAPPSLNCVASSLTGAFHQQLPNLSSCNNPAHQSVATFSSQALPSPNPMGLLPQNGPAPMPVAPSNFVPNHVPKPKVPNTAGQQNWELMHELRRSMEPGYAQKCKEKQKKRFMKQLEKGSTGQT